MVNAGAYVEDEEKQLFVIISILHSVNIKAFTKC